MLKAPYGQKEFSLFKEEFREEIREEFREEFREGSKSLEKIK